MRGDRSGPDLEENFCRFPIALHPARRISTFRMTVGRC